MKYISRHMRELLLFFAASAKRWRKQTPTNMTTEMITVLSLRAKLNAEVAAKESLIRRVELLAASVKASASILANLVSSIPVGEDKALDKKAARCTADMNGIIETLSE